MSNKEDLKDKLDFFLIDLMEKGMFEYLEPYSNAGEGVKANTLVGSPSSEIIEFLEKEGFKRGSNE